MRFYSYQQMGCLPDKKEMEDRIVASGNILCDGLHVIAQAKPGIYAVLDGVGGMYGSAYASTLAARALADINNDPADEELLQKALESVHNDLVEYSRTATTATGMVISESKILLFHIGNCRLYGLFDGYLRQLTVDQTRYEDMRKQGIAEAEIPDSAKCVLNACLGAKKELISSLVIVNITKQVEGCSRIMITSDGIHDFVSIESMEEIMNSPAIKPSSLSGLANLAVENGSQDDLSVLVLER